VASTVPVTIVSGLPRSGTSLMMQMLAAGGLPALTDHIREADEDNPHGYLEFERAKQSKQDAGWLDDAHGKAVKMVHLLLLDLPLDRQYRVIFMRRDLREVLASQRRMLERSNRAGAQLSDEALAKVFAEQVERVLHWLRGQPNFIVLEVLYSDLVAAPAEHAHQINTFLGGGLNEAAMALAVDPALYRNRTPDRPQRIEADHKPS
jgi:hypothetical protein